MTSVDATNPGSPTTGLRRWGSNRERSPTVFPTLLTVKMEQVLDLSHERAQAAGVIVVFHQELAGGANVGQHRNPARDFVEDRERQIEAAALGQGDQMNDGVGQPPSAMSTVMALRNDSSLRISLGVRPSQAICTTRLPVSMARRG